MISCTSQRIWRQHCAWQPCRKPQGWSHRQLGVRRGPGLHLVQAMAGDKRIGLLVFSSPESEELSELKDLPPQLEIIATGKTPQELSGPKHAYSQHLDDAETSALPC